MTCAQAWEDQPRITDSSSWVPGTVVSQPPLALSRGLGWGGGALYQSRCNWTCPASVRQLAPCFWTFWCSLWELYTDEGSNPPGPVAKGMVLLTFPLTFVSWEGGPPPTSLRACLHAPFWFPSTEHALPWDALLSELP